MSNNAGKTVRSFVNSHVLGKMVETLKIASDETSTESSSEVLNSATEISTDSEFAHDDPTPTREALPIILNDSHITKTRGKYTQTPKKVQVTSIEYQQPVRNKPQARDIELKFKPLVLPSLKVNKPQLLNTEGYALSRTQSTGGIAAKVSLELKKKYLLGECSPLSSIQKSGSASTLDSKFKSFHSTISDCQKLLSNVAPPPQSPVSPTFFRPIEKSGDEAEEAQEVKTVIINEVEGRPRSPVHETSIIVPQIDWSKQKKSNETNSESSSSSSSSISSSDSEVKEMQKSPSVKFTSIPKLEVEDVDDVRWGEDVGRFKVRQVNMRRMSRGEVGNEEHKVGNVESTIDNVEQYTVSNECRKDGSDQLNKDKNERRNEESEGNDIRNEEVAKAANEQITYVGNERKVKEISDCKDMPKVLNYSVTKDVSKEGSYTTTKNGSYDVSKKSYNISKGSYDISKGSSSVIKDRNYEVAKEQKFDATKDRSYSGAKVGNNAETKDASSGITKDSSYEIPEGLARDESTKETNIQVTKAGSGAIIENEHLTKLENERLTKAAVNERLTKATVNERLTKTENDRLTKAENERLAKAENERLAKAENDRLTAAENDRLTKVENERLAKPENERLTKAENDYLSKAENERLTKSANERSIKDDVTKKGIKKSEVNKNVSSLSKNRIENITNDGIAQITNKNNKKGIDDTSGLNLNGKDALNEIAEKTDPEKLKSPELVENLKNDHKTKQVYTPQTSDTSPEQIDSDLPLDSLNFYNYTKLESPPSSINEPPKSISSEKKTLNPPKSLPNLSDDVLLNQVHAVLHSRNPTRSESGRSTPSNNEGTVLTETELSDWARDGAGSDDFDDFDEYEGKATIKKAPKKAMLAEMDEMPKTPKMTAKTPKPILTECVNNILNPNLDNIEFMDTGSESSEEEEVVKNNGYIQFHDEEDMAEDSLSPVVNVVETMNPKVMATFDEDFDDLSTVTRNTGYCIIGNEELQKNAFGAEIIDLKPSDLEKLKEKQNQCENEEDSLLIVEPGTTTEENTCSDSTVKNITQITPIKEITITENNNTLDKKRLEDKLAQVKKDMKKLSEERKAAAIAEQNLRNNIEFEQHCQRLQSRVEFGNARDSIDVRKSRRQSKSSVSPPKPDLIQEEKEVVPPLTKREQIEKERDTNKKLIEEMVMNKMRAQNKSLERKKRNRNSFSPSVSPCRPSELNKSATTDIGALKTQTPDVLLSTMHIVKSETVSALSELHEPRATPRAKKTTRPLSLHTTIALSNEALSLPDIQKALQIPRAPPRAKNDEAKRTIEKLKEDARARARLLTDADLGLSPEDKLAKLRLLIRRPEATPKNNSFRRSKSNEYHIESEAKECTKGELKNRQQCFKSDPNLLGEEKFETPKKVKKSKDRERRKSITKKIMDLLTKKKDPGGTAGNKGFLSRISPKAKDKSKEVIEEEPAVRRMSFTEVRRPAEPGNVSPPPIPPLPLHYTGTKSIDDSSDGESEFRRVDLSSCDTLDQSGMQDPSASSRRSRRSAKKAARQSQLKRHRMAQEIQRKLEETEVKTRELEQRGVRVEKALRGEAPEETAKDETELLREWFDLMRDMTELRRYEKELMVRAQELELEDRHARLQHELRERLDTDGKKTEEDIKTEGSIIKEMMDIVRKRDSLISLLEEDRQRYTEEDKGFEEQMVARGLTQQQQQPTVLLKVTDK